MELSSRFESLTLVGAVVAAAVLGVGSHAVGAAVGDLAILLALFGFDGQAARSGAGSVAFSGASAFCLLTPLFFLKMTILGGELPSDATPWMFCGVWAVATLILFSVDRFRMSARDNVSLAGSGLAAALPKPIVSAAPATNYRPAPIRVEQPPAYAPPAPLPTFVAETPVAELSAANFATPAVEYSTVPAAAPAVPDVTLIPPGREALIYLNLVGEGLNVLRTVRAENLGRDYYRIADVMPEGEQWEFTPGQVVKCRKKALSNGKHMVAYEEAPRAQ